MRRFQRGKVQAACQTGEPRGPAEIQGRWDRKLGRVSGLGVESRKCRSIPTRRRRHSALDVRKRLAEPREFIQLPSLEALAHVLHSGKVERRG